MCIQNMEVEVQVVSSRTKVQLQLEVLSFCLCLLTVVLQFSVLNYYIVHYLNNNLWILLSIVDFAVCVVFAWILRIAVQFRTECSKKFCATDSNIKYAFICWITYSLALIIKICIIFRLVVSHLSKAEVFGPSVLELTLTFSALAFLFLVFSHHFNDPRSRRQAYISYLASSVTLDIIDSVAFLKFLLDPRIHEDVYNSLTLQIVILVLACFNFILPTFALSKLRFNIELPRWLPLPYEQLYSLLYFLTVNLPYLVIRAHLWTSNTNSMSDGTIFIVKNVIMIMVGIREMWIGYLQRQQSMQTTIGM